MSTYMLSARRSPTGEKVCIANGVTVPRDISENLALPIIRSVSHVTCQPRFRKSWCSPEACCAEVGLSLGDETEDSLPDPGTGLMG